MKALIYLSRTLAFLFHPLLIATYLSATLLFYTHGIFSFMSVSQRITFLWLIFIATFILPLLIAMLAIIIHKNQLTFSDLYLESKIERSTIFSIVSIVYLFIAYYLYHTWYNHYILAIILAFMSISILFTAIISRFWLISAHAVGLGGLVASILVFNISFVQTELFKLLIPVLLLSGLVMSSRVFLQKHSLNQVYAGFTLGFIICACSILFI
jgi:membrane-associated phospholipid phosphatase